MKSLLIIALLSAPASSAPYFRLLDLSKPQVSAGAFIDAERPGNTSAGSMLAVVMHSTRDGCLLPTLVCEDWSALSIGFASHAGETIFAIGPSINLSPAIKGLLFRALTASTRDGSFRGLKDTLSSEPIGGAMPTVSFGPALAFAPARAWRGYFRVFTGASWRF